MFDNQLNATQDKKRIPLSLNWLLALVLIYLLICAIGIIGSAFNSGAIDYVSKLFQFAYNPFAGLVIGIIATALIQSSSTVTSVLVSFVAGGLPIEIAIPIVMGANVGTSFTNTIISLSHIQAKEQFQRAFAAATIHDFFNVLSVLIFLPLEMSLGLLEKISHWSVNLFYGTGDISINSFNLIKTITAPVIHFVGNLANQLSQFGDIILLLLGTVLVFFTINSMSNLLKVLMIGKAKNIMQIALGRKPITGILSGTVMTVMVQSSSTTTSLIVPLASSGACKLREVYPFTLGANIGTCITALLAATAVVGNAHAALQIALIHLFYNILGVLVIYGIPALRNLPILAAETLAKTAVEHKFIALTYILSLFFILPIVFLSISNVFLH